MESEVVHFDQSVLWRHAKRLGVTWTRYGGRSVKGEPAPAAGELRLLRQAVRRDRGANPADLFTRGRRP